MNNNIDDNNKDIKNGRPTLYKEEYCEDIVRLAKKGVNLYLIAEQFEVTKTSLLEWKKVHKRFSVAYTRASNILMGLTVKKVEDNIDNKNFNANGARLVWAQHNLAEQRALQISGLGQGTLLQRGEAILQSVAEGNLTADEFQKSVTALSQLAKIEEVTELREKLEKYEEAEKNTEDYRVKRESCEKFVND